jgi:hypothetical protein
MDLRNKNPQSSSWQGFTFHELLELQSTTSPRRVAFAYSSPGSRLICYAKKREFSFAIDEHKEAERR